ncbi:MAG: shikimate kinase [Promethearchaeota archaeon]|jgi:shikimate kinase
MKKNSIALIGFMATGKTTVGKALAKYLGKKYSFIETDQMIIKMVGKPIPSIFSEEGESKFREYESIVCKKASRLKRTVISCGGGVVLDKKNITNLKKNCHIVLLTATHAEIYTRAMKDGKETRPIIDKEDPKTEIEMVLKYRKPFYDSAAELIIETTGRKIENIVREIAIATQLKT